MIFYVYSRLTKENIAYNLGEPEYSYYFVLQEYLPVLKKLGEVVHITDPATEVDPLFIDALERGIPSYFLSFTPPHLTQTGLKCPTIPVFAWEFDTIPNETWWTDQPQNDWRNNLKKFGAAIVHSQFTAQSVRKEMAPGFPVLSIPAPVWDRLEPLRQVAMQKSANNELVIDSGILFDSHDADFYNWLPSEKTIAAHIAANISEENGIAALKPNLFEKSSKSRVILTKWFFYAAIESLIKGIAPQQAKNYFNEKKSKLSPWNIGRRKLNINGIVFTSVFNPYDGRKNWTDIISAFCTTFKDKSGATLVLKLGHYKYHLAIESMLLTLARMPKFACRIIIIHGHLDSSSYTKLIQATDFFVNASHGEGQCLPLMEYLSCGKPAIAPRNSAMLDYIDEQIAFVVNSFEDYTTWPHDPRVAYRARRHQIDWSSLANAYQDAYTCITQEPERYKLMSKTAITRMQKHCSQAVTMDKLRSILGMHQSPLPLKVPEQELARMPNADQWVRTSRSPDFVDARDCGLVDAVKSGWYQAQSDELFKGFPVSAEDVVVDLGCGAGGATLFCANRGAAVTYIDINPQTIKSLAEKVSKTNAREQQGIVSSSYPLPLADNFASRIIAMEVIEHVDYPLETLKELERIGQPGALYLLSVPDALGEHVQKPIAPDNYYTKPNHIHIFERARFAEQVEQAGLTIIEHDTYGFFWTFWMLLHWTSMHANSEPSNDISHDAVQPPYYPLTNSWSALWHQFLQLPNADAVKRQLDNVLPKSQIILAQKKR